jgi:hypothetical protein
MKKKFLKTVMLISSGVFIVDAAFGIEPENYRIQTASGTVYAALEAQFGRGVTCAELDCVALILAEVTGITLPSDAARHRLDELLLWYVRNWGAISSEISNMEFLDENGINVALYQ